jgi:hypothetical protein
VRMVIRLEPIWIVVFVITLDGLQFTWYTTDVFRSFQSDTYKTLFISLNVLAILLSTLATLIREEDILR